LIKTAKVRLQRKFSFSSTPFPKENLVFTLNAENLTNRFIFSRWISLPVIVLFFISGRCVNADPVGDLFKRVGQSVSKAFEPRATPNPAEKKTAKRAPRRPNSRNLTATAAASPTPLEQRTDLVKEEKVTPTVTVQRAASVPPEKANGDLPYGIPVPGYKGMVTSPYSPEGNYIDVSAFASGSAVKDPYTGKTFLVP
jgi:hypothetical protein